MNYFTFLLLYLLPLFAMKISIIQPDIVWENKSRNFQNLSGLISPLINNTDIVILPEMFNTGFSMNPKQFSESSEAETLKWMKSTAKIGNFGVCGSYMVNDNGRYYNRWIFVSPQEEMWYYDKRHLFGMGDENKFFTAGKSRLVFTFRGVRISPYICYDIRFPVWSRNHNDYDLAVYSANWPEARINVWNTLLQARAIENQCFVAGSNRIGTDGNGIKYCGDSAIIGPRGDVLASAETNSECSFSAEISLTHLSEFRNKFPVTRDADNFTIKI
jgi:omega-amidase